MQTHTRPTPPRIAPATVHQVTPALGWYSDHILFGEIWEDPALSKRDRSLITVATLITRGHMAQLTGHFNRALNHGLSPTEIAETVTHLAFYAGWPAAISSLTVLRQVFESRGITLDQVTQSTCDDQPLGLATITQRTGGHHIELHEVAQQVLQGSLWQRTELSLRDRSLITIASCLAQGQTDVLCQEVQIGTEQHGLTQQDLLAAFTHLVFYAGWPCVRAAEKAVMGA